MAFTESYKIGGKSLFFFYFTEIRWNFLVRIRVTYYDITLSDKLHNLHEKTIHFTIHV